MNLNPCDPPTTAANAKSVVDRAGRDALAETIRLFLDEQTSAFRFDESLDEFRNSSDPGVRFVTRAVWYHYDDCDDHVVTLSKDEWDYLQRLLLLLESDCQVAITSVRRWSWTQFVACGCLVGFGWCIWRFGWGEHLLVLSIPFGLISIVISFLRNANRTTGAYDQILAPFSTFSDLSATYRSSRAFTKMRYPSALTNRRIRSRVAEFGIRLQMYAGWLLLSPIPLLVQTFPLTETRTDIKPVNTGLTQR